MKKPNDEGNPVPAAEQPVPKPGEASGPPPPPTPQAPPQEATVPLSRYEESSREGRRLAEEVKRLAAENAEKDAQLAQVSEAALEADLKKSYPDWELMDPAAQQLAREKRVEESRRQQAEAELARYRSKEDFDKRFRELVSGEEFKELGGDADAFRSYAEQHPGTDLAVLARSFLYDKKAQHSAAAAADAASRPGSEAPGYGGSEIQPTPEETEDAELTRLGQLRQSDPKAYEEAIRARVRSKVRR